MTKFTHNKLAHVHILQLAAVPITTIAILEEEEAPVTHVMESAPTTAALEPDVVRRSKKEVEEGTTGGRIRMKQERMRVPLMTKIPLLMLMKK